MDIRSIHLSLNNLIDNDYPPPDGLIHSKRRFQFSLVQLENSTYRVCIDREDNVHIVTGSLILATPLQTQWIWETMPRSSNWARRLFFNIDINDGYSIDLFYEFPIMLDNEVTQQIIPLLAQIADTQDVFARKIVCYQIAKLLFSRAKPRKHPANPKIIQILRYIHNHYAHALNVPLLAETHQISQSGLYALFKQYCHTSPIAYINSYRLEEAAKLLINTDLSVSQIGEIVGFENFSYFCRCFRKTFFTTPSQYRKAKQQTGVRL